MEASRKAYELAAEHESWTLASNASGIPESTLRKRSGKYRNATGLPHPFRSEKRKSGEAKDRESYDMAGRYGSWKRASEATGIPESTLRGRAERIISKGSPKPIVPNEDETAETIGKNDDLMDGVRVALTKHYREPEYFDLPEKGGVKRYILTCAQNNTEVFDDYWENLLAMKDAYGAELLVSRFSYAKGILQKQSAKPGTDKPSDGDMVWYDDKIVPYLCDKQVCLAPGIVFCGELNILPTAVRPLSGLATYTRRESMVVPHVKLAMESYGVRKGSDPRFGYTTGTVTMRNYIQRKAGQKAEFHHIYGALVVEVDDAGRWWARQLSADGGGGLRDLGLAVENGEVSEDNVASVTWGDIHVARLDDSAQVCWGKESMARALKPDAQFFHDVLDFQSRNHHDAFDNHKAYEKFAKGTDGVEREVKKAAKWLEKRKKEAAKWGGDAVVVHSNHDDFFVKWLKTDGYRHDPMNAVFFLEAQLAYYKSIRDEAEGRIPNRVEPFEWAYGKYCTAEIDFLRENDTRIVAGVEHSYHGHLGINGVRGSRRNLSNLGDKLNIGHSHSAGIQDGVYQAGVTGSLDMGYNRGPSSWSHSHIVTYKNSKRTIITVRNGKWRA